MDIKPASVQAVGALGYSPLYLQVRQQLIDKIVSGDWPPGSILPSEHQLGIELGVSQGTVRKALDSLAAERIVIRRQGKGTFVSEHNQKRELFQFFKVFSNAGERKSPSTLESKLSKAKASKEEAKFLGLEDTDEVWRIDRLRGFDDKVALTERISIAVTRFAELDKHDPLPNNIYRLYEQAYGVTITRAAEKLSAVKASKASAKALSCSPGDPLLQIDRVAYSLDDQPSEVRRTLLLTDNYHYLSDLR